MSEEQTLETVNKIFKLVFERENQCNLALLLEKFAFDIKLPKEVRDSTTNEVTWADSINSGRFITLHNMEEFDKNTGWMQEKRDLNSLKDILEAWKKVNLTTTERVYDSINVSKSDTIYNCENVYNSTDCSNSKNIIFCNSCGACEYLLASQRSGSSSFCIRCDDSKDCSNSYNVICSNKVSNSLFIQDCFNLHECIFCSHIANKKYCIANMQFDKDEYFEIKKVIIGWILNS